MVLSRSDTLSPEIRLMLRGSKRRGEIWDQDKKAWEWGSDIRNKPGNSSSPDDRAEQAGVWSWAHNSSLPPQPADLGDSHFVCQAEVMSR